MDDPTQLIRLGACRVTYNGVDLGFTKGGVEVSVATTTRLVKIDNYNQEDVREYVERREVSIKVPMAETDIARLNLVIPGSAIVTDSITHHTKLVVSESPGVAINIASYPLVLHPIDKADFDKSEDVIVPIAGPTGNIDFSFNYDKERIYSIEFKAYPNPSSGVLFEIGDLSTSAWILTNGAWYDNGIWEDNEFWKDSE